MRLQRHHILSCARYIRLAIIGGVVCAAAVEVTGSTATASGSCPNEAFRVEGGENGPGPSALISEDGSTVYYDSGGDIYRYDTATEVTSFVAAAKPPRSPSEPSYTTPSGRYLVFGASGVEVENGHGLEVEARGVGHNELYRYDNATGSVICVSCGEGVAPMEGEVIGLGAVLITEDEVPAPVQISENGQEVFFQTTARLVPQDTNSTEYNLSDVNPAPGLDVYEWEASGAGGCDVSVGCTYLLSSGEASGASHFLGASRDGSNVFFSSAAQLLPQATPEFTNIYDARVDGGFAPPSAPDECLSCQGVGNPPPTFTQPASGTSEGTGNLAPPAPNPTPTPAPSPAPAPSSAPAHVPTPAPKPSKPKCKHDYTHNKRGRCVRTKTRVVTTRMKRRQS